MNSARSPVKWIIGQMRGLLQLTIVNCRPTISGVFLSHSLYINSCRCPPAETGAHQFSKLFHFSSINQSALKGAFMLMLVQHLCTSILYSLIVRALHGPLISSDSRLSAAAINQHWRYRPHEVCYGAGANTRKVLAQTKSRAAFSLHY